MYRKYIHQLCILTIHRDHPNKKSLFELLVSFEQTQDQMVSLLLDALVDDEEANRRVTLHGLRLIDRVFNVGSVIRNLTSVLAKVSQQTRMDLVKLAFEIVPESQHKSLIADLAVLMTNNRELMASPVLTMSSRVEIEDLNLRSELVDSALKNLSKHAPIETLRFLFSTVPTTKSLELYESLRQHTDTAELTRMRVFDLFIGKVYLYIIVSHIREQKLYQLN